VRVWDGSGGCRAGEAQTTASIRWVLATEGASGNLDTCCVDRGCRAFPAPFDCTVPGHTAPTPRVSE
jgi:hypothetical protein